MTADGLQSCFIGSSWFSSLTAHPVDFELASLDNCVTNFLPYIFLSIYRGSGRSKAYSSVVGWVRIWVYQFIVLIWTFYLKHHTICLSVILLCYRITWLWFCNKRLCNKKGHYLCLTLTSYWFCFSGELWLTHGHTDLHPVPCAFLTIKCWCPTFR